MIDIVLVKSISRFARNTVDLLNTVRRLHELGIEVHFEKEGINTATADGELLLTLLAGFAQEESRSISENVKWGTRKRFQQGIPNGRHSVYGYRWEDDQLVIVPEEAEVLRLIYKKYLNGISAEQTENQLREMGITTRAGEPFTGSTIRKMLVNITYAGSFLLQKEYVADPLTHHKKSNRGELPQYLVENDTLDRTTAFTVRIIRSHKFDPFIPRNDFFHYIKKFLPLGFLLPTTVLEIAEALLFHLFCPLLF